MPIGQPAQSDPSQGGTAQTPQVWAGQNAAAAAGAAGGNTTGSNPQLNQLVQQLLSVIAPSSANAAGQEAQLGQQAQGLPNTIGQQEAIQKQMAGFQQQQNTLSGQGITANQQLLGTQGQYQQGLGGAFDASNPTQQGLLGYQQYLAGQQYGIQQSQLPGEFAARGAVGTTGMHQAQEQAALGYSGQQAQFGYSEAQLKNQSDALDRSAKANGISSQEISANLQNMLDQTQLGGILSLNDIYNQMHQVQTGEFSSILAALAPIAQAYGLNLFAGTQ